MDQLSDQKSSSDLSSAPLDECSDEELVGMFQDGRETAFDELVRRYQDYIYRTIYYQVSDHDRANDLAQQTFVNAYEGLSDFEGRSSFKTWIYRIARNLCYSEHRRRARDREQPVGTFLPGRSDEDGETAFPEPEHSSNPPDDNVAAEEKKEIVRSVIRSLDEDFCTILTLRELEGHSYDEMAELLEIPVGTVRSRLYRAREAFREVLEERYGHELETFF